MASPTYVIGDTHRFRFTVTKDGVAWDLSAATAQVIMIPPGGGATTAYTATIENTTGGILYYDFTIAAPVQSWATRCRVFDGSVIGTSRAFLFEVEAVS